MTKKGIAFVIISSLIFGAAGSWVFQGYIIPKLNTVPFFVRHNLAPKAGPLVINTREEIRVNEGSDTIAAIQRVQPWTVAVISGSQVVAGGLLLTSDGLIATTAAAQNAPAPEVKLMDGTLITGAKVVATDPASSLVFIKVSGSNLPTANFGRSADLELSQRMVALLPSIGEQQSQSLVSYISALPRDTDYSQIYSSEKIWRTFKVDGLQNLPEGSTLLSADGNVEGLSSGSAIISSDTISSALNSYFANGSKIVRNKLGVNYQVLPKVLAQINSEKQGVILKSSGKTPAVEAGSPAQKAGLLEGDLIYAVDDTQIDVNNNFEDLLAKHKPGDAVKFSVQRGKDSKTFNITLEAQ